MAGQNHQEIWHSKGEFPEDEDEDDHDDENEDKDPFARKLRENDLQTECRLAWRRLVFRMSS
jgi:hypothetical protein